MEINVTSCSDWMFCRLINSLKTPNVDDSLL